MISGPIEAVAIFPKIYLWSISNWRFSFFLNDPLSFSLLSTIIYMFRECNPISLKYMLCGVCYGGWFTRGPKFQVTWVQSMQFQPLRAWKLGLITSHGVPSSKFQLWRECPHGQIFFWRWGLGLVLWLGSSKKLDPTLNPSPTNFLLHKITKIQLQCWLTMF